MFPVTSVEINHHHHHHKHQGLGHSARSVSTVTAALANVSLASRLFSFLVDYSGMFSTAFFTGVKASSFSIHLSCLVCIQSAVRGV